MECLIIKMQNFIVLFTLLTFSSDVVFAGLQEVINVAKCIADIHQELPNCCVFIMESERERSKVRNISFIFLVRMVRFKKKVFKFSVTKRYKLSWNYIFGNKKTRISFGIMNSIHFDGMFQVCLSTFKFLFSYVLTA